MDAIIVAQRYFDAWNRRDAEAIAAMFAEGGVYRDPTVPDGVTGPGIAAYAAGLFGAFPDLSFELVSLGQTGNGTVVAQWLMHGTNVGPFAGGPPTGRHITLPGADFIAIAGDAIRAVEGYFDQRTLAERLGLQALVQPYQLGPVTFGRAIHMRTGKRTRPGAFSLTSLTVRSDEEVQEVQARAQAILADMAAMPGFVAFLGAAVGRHLFTVTAWEDPEAPRQLLRGGAHKEAMARFYGPEFAVGGQTGVWAPHHLNARWVRCPACGDMEDYDRLEGKSGCGRPLPDPPPYW
jgi:steroid delta-isomerase-like uncharacterized protein